MSSPFNPLTPLLPSGTPFLPTGFGLSPQPASPATGVSPWFLQPQPGSAGSFGLGTSGLPLSVPASGLPLPGQHSQSGPGGVLGGVGLVAPPTHTVAPSTDLDDALRALPEITRRLERAEALRAECAMLEERAFREPAGDTRVEGAQLEYAQVLLELISLTGTYLVGALPLSEPPIGAQTPLAELAAWTEQRAEAQFARREAVKDAGKAVVEVLSKKD